VQIFVKTASNRNRRSIFAKMFPKFHVGGMFFPAIVLKLASERHNLSLILKVMTPIYHNHAKLNQCFEESAANAKERQGLTSMRIISVRGSIGLEVGISTRLLI